MRPFWSGWRRSTCSSASIDRAIARIDSLERQGKGSPSAEQLAILTLEEQGKKPEARATAAVRPARSTRRSPELAGLDAALVAKDGKPAEADRILADFLKTLPIIRRW